MKGIITVSVACLILMMAGCSGKDKITKDNNPPIAPILIPHLGDTGDQPVHYQGQTINLDEDNNGIDAVPDGDWIRIPWEHFLDTDLNYVRIYRFDNFNPVPAMIDSISANSDYYLDSHSQLSTNVVYSYFIDLVDNAGNSSRSDTVSYSLLSKQVLVSPANGSTITYSSSTPIDFNWQKSGDVSTFRILVFDDQGNYIWHHDIPVTTEGDFFDYPFPSNLALQYSGKTLYWRVDAMQWDAPLGINIGSESNEWVFTITQVKDTH